MKLKPIGQADLEALVELTTRRFGKKKEETYTVLTEGVENGEALLRINLQAQLALLMEKGWGWALEDDRGCLFGYFRHQEGRAKLSLPRLLRLQREMMGALTKEGQKRVKQNGKKLNLKNLSAWRKRVCKGPYYYVNILCIDESLKGSGAFRTLITPALRRADRLGIPVLLDTFDEHNVQIYEHFGFQTVEKKDCGAGLTLHGMMRPPED
ncbi:hypothetical protein LJC49_10390 [Ruminococcaceae bacterium OttesenSCG-928-I18]|nr:hypothetical protein [Ruminococcaceae bacterium OttesenSCG-928-I18]